jgi:hypothetical protein
MKFDFLEKLRSRDEYGKNISLTYQGSDTFQTVFGGCVSMAINIGLFYLTVVLFIPCFMGEISSFQTDPRFIETNGFNLNPF